jgi:hypothetical protein
VSQEKQAAEQTEAAELLKKMHEAAGIKPEVVTEDVSPSNFEKLSAGIPEMTDKEQLISGRSRVIEGAKYSPEEKEALLKSIDSRLEELGGKNTAEVGTESAAQNVESKQEKLATKEAALSPEQMEQQQRFDDAENLYKSLNLSRGFKEGKYQGASNENISEKIRLGLADEEWNDSDTRRKTLITTGSAAVIGAAATMGAGFLAPSLLAVGGIASVGIAAIGGLGWAGMKAYHALKERRHRKAFDKLQHA